MKMQNNRLLHVLMVFSILLFCLNAIAVSANPDVSIVIDKTDSKTSTYALNKLTEAFTSKNITCEKIQSINEARGKYILAVGLTYGNGLVSQLLKTGNHEVPKVAEALTIWKTVWQKQSVWVISGFDDRGLMYGILDVAKRIGWSNDPKDPMSEVKEITEKPDITQRAVSIYTMNRAYWESRFYDEVYWSRYLDMLAQNRFNSLVVIFGYENGGFLAPCYPYFFNVDEFPGVQMVGITAQEQRRNLESLNKLIKMAHEHGVMFTVGIWDHIYRGGVQAGGIVEALKPPTQPEYGLVWGVNDANLVTYNKTALAKFVKLVPELDAIQFRMHNESGLKKSEQDVFWSDVFKMMRQTAPNLRLDLRAKELPESVVQSALDIGVNFRITTKYWMEQMGMPFHPTFTNRDPSPRRQSYADMLRYPQQYKMHWRLWNGGTSRVLLWGDPEYAQRFAESTHLYDGDGFEVNEPLATKMEAQPHDAKPFDLLNANIRYYDYEFERYWHFFQVFGRIGYNPNVDPEVWQKEFELRFGQNAAPYIEAALHKASWILPRIVATCYPYKYFPTTRGWAEKQRLGDLPSYAKAEGSDLAQFANFDEEAQILVEGGETAKLLPSMNSVWFEQTSAEINELIEKAEKVIGKNRNKEFNSTIADLKILSNLALFHARRIPAAINYRIFERTRNVTALEKAIDCERNATEAWQQIVNASTGVYAPDLMMGLRSADLCGNWNDELTALRKGLENLEQTRKDFKANAVTKPAPVYKKAMVSSNRNLFQTIHEPVKSAATDKPITIEIKVNATNGVKWITLNYRNVNQDQTYQTLPMLPTEEKNTYKVTVPSGQINPKWDFMYYISMMDNKGNGMIYPDFNKETPYIVVKLIR